MPSLSRRNALKAGGVAAGTLLVPTIHRAAAQDTKITFWNGIYPVEDPNDKTKDKNDYYIYKAIERFQAANPGITVEMENLPSNPSMFTKYRTAGVAKNGPDVMGMWSGTYMLNLSDFIEPLGGYFSAEERARVRGWEAVNPEFTVDSPNIFGAPNATDGMCSVFLNKELFGAAGLNPETDWPSDFDSFVTMLDALKNSGVTPLALENYGYLWFLLLWWIGQSIGGSQGYADLASGARKFSDEPILGIVQKWLSLASYAAEGAPQMDGIARSDLMRSGECALTITGAWALNDYTTMLGDKLMLKKIPDFSAEAGIKGGGVGGSGTCLIVSNYSEHKDAAVAFIKYMLSAAEQTEKAKAPEGGLINVTDVDTTTIFTDPNKQMQQDWAYEPSLLFYADNTLQADLVTEISAQGALAWTGAMSAEDFLKACDDKRDSLLG